MRDQTADALLRAADLAAEIGDRATEQAARAALAAAGRATHRRDDACRQGARKTDTQAAV
jgi:type IV secretory pathway VirB6-like protein